MTDIEQMKAELEANDYCFGRTDVMYSFDLGRRGIRTNTMFVANDGFYLTGKPEYIIPKAYAHLQKRKELEALRALRDVVNHWLGGASIVRLRQQSYNDTDMTTISYGALRAIGVAWEIADQYNITADDESDDDEK